MAKILIPNYEFVENWSEDQLNDFLTTPSGLPNRLMMIVRKVYPNINTLRLKASIDNPNFESLDQDERAITHKMSIE